MKLRLLQQWQLLRESLWFVPGLMVLAAIAAAFGLVRYDAQTTVQGTKHFPLLFGIGADASRGMLTAIAGSMLTVATLAFSVTLAAFSQISTQYSPRVLRNFMRDQVNQVIMGYFVGVFAYCLAVLGTIRGPEEGKFVPSSAVLAGLLLAMGGVAALVFFIHHIAESLQTGTLVRNIALETLEAVEDLFPSHFGEAVADERQVATAKQLLREQAGWHPLPATACGYLQRIDTVGLLHWAIRHRAVLRINFPMGAFVGEGQPLFSVRQGQDAPGEPRAEWPAHLMDYVSIGRHRNIEQDIGFGIQQLVDIALKALSIGINDTTTAIMAVDYLGEICGRLARREFPAPWRGAGQHLRVLVNIPTFEDYIRLSFNLVRLNAQNNPAVLRRMLRALALAGEQVLLPERKAVLREQAALVLASAEANIPNDYEKHQVEALYEELHSVWQ
ncbi:DUF2254 domain-containing protein [Hymenobacter sp. BT770]|uniref:DUF2254 domain-containing protein n=1 Tax=Hymenobacter sp. BT770 TaxID=2886942 RepID=UPI001D10A2E4|nr:DUF2254 domain-containing protein [Hymenobacter sp. BT770]MCC3153562.1 DUF2254 domain-containing protein [Hymenobacter sp. BT770]MDO3415798.1 DUF2254 domain-containing protein [Hymenobacter sp. BT770]